ncbi:hypothetical protein EYF80_064178 [Liparis tanakae]|uniref:Uncharacterized protein n=1 Tax=Liparis tanakae TaxID=230148 RepID=A0A4Z2EAB7_9TELE|nr:hypothetical protein EYF80_064178 [Liparis tanakae]
MNTPRPGNIVAGCVAEPSVTRCNGRVAGRRHGGASAWRHGGTAAWRRAAVSREQSNMSRARQALMLGMSPSQWVSSVT